MLHIKVNHSELQFEPVNQSVLIDGKAVNADVVKLDKNKYHILIDNASYNVELLEKDEQGKQMQIRVNGVKQTVSVKDKYDDLLKQLGMDKLMGKKSNVVKAPMPGLVLKVLVEPNQAVKKGDGLVILEAMKMENIIKADNDAVVKKINVEIKQAVEKNTVLIEME